MDIEAEKGCFKAGLFVEANWLIEIGFSGRACRLAGKANDDDEEEDDEGDDEEDDEEDDEISGRTRLSTPAAVAFFLETGEGAFVSIAEGS